MKKFLLAAALVGLSAVVPLSGAAAAPPSLAGLSARQVLAWSVVAMHSAKSVTRISHEKVLTQSVTATTSSTWNAGVQHLDLLGRRGEVVFVHGVVYVRLDAGLVTPEFHSKVAGVANRWVSFTRVSKYYAVFSTGLTLSSLLSKIAPTGVLTMSRPITLNGVNVVAIAGKVATTNSLVKASATLFIATTPPFLPVQETITALVSGVTVSAVTMFKNWGSPLEIVAPKVFTPSWRISLP